MEYLASNFDCGFNFEWSIDDIMYCVVKCDVICGGVRFLFPLACRVMFTKLSTLFEIENCLVRYTIYVTNNLLI